VLVISEVVARGRRCFEKPARKWITYSADGGTVIEDGESNSLSSYVMFVLLCCVHASERPVLNFRSFSTSE
jgi:hypothetical protein